MKIHFTKKEYRLLVDMLCIADWVLHSRDMVDKPQHIEHHDLYQKLLSLHKEMGAEDIVENDDSTYYETGSYEEELMEKFIKPYNGETFWEELVDRLAMRELSKTVGFERFQEMDIEEQAKVMTDIVNRYEDEFEEHGLDRVKILDEDVVVSTS